MTDESVRGGDDTIEPVQAKLPWVSPEIRRIDVKKTSFNGGGGADGETRYPDCSHS